MEGFAPERESERRGFKISHQYIVLDIDFAHQTLEGFTEITVVPTSTALKTIILHSRHCTIDSITVNSLPAEFCLVDPFSKLDLLHHDWCNHLAIKRRVYSALQESDEGELMISIPKEVSVRPLDSSDDTDGDPDSNADDSDTSSNAADEASEPQYPDIMVRIIYTAKRSSKGLQFIVPSTTNPYQPPHAFTSPTSHDSARCWVPCIDNAFERCKWNLQFTVSHYFEHGDAAETVNVIASGERVAQTLHVSNENTSTFSFVQARPISAQHIFFAAGPFSMAAIESSTYDGVPIHIFSLPGYELAMACSLSVSGPALQHFTQLLNVAYPFQGAYQIIAVQGLPVQCFNAAGMTIISTDLLHDPKAIEQTIETRYAIVHAIASQWLGVWIGPETWSDLWLINGMALYIAGKFLKELFGNNEYSYRLKKDIQRVVELEKLGMPPICSPWNLHSISTMSFINLKGSIVLHLLDRQLSTTAFRVGLDDIMRKLLSFAVEGNHPYLSTAMFLDMAARRIGGSWDSFAFAQQWIYGSGCPTFQIKTRLPAREHAIFIELDMTPSQFEGSLIVLVHDGDATFEHVLYVQPKAGQEFRIPFDGRRGNFRWIQFDPDLEWIGKFNFEQDTARWMSQLMEGDVVAQLDAIHALAESPSESTSSTLTRTILDFKIYFKIRCEAALLLSRCAIASLGYIGLVHLLRIFSLYCYSQDSSGNNQSVFEERFIPMPNNFEDIQEYFVRKSIIVAISRVYSDDGTSSFISRRFLIDQLRYNDNTNNEYSDSLYVATIISAIASTMVSAARGAQSELAPSGLAPGYSNEDHELLAQAMEEIEKLCELDIWAPSYHNIVTIAVLEFQSLLIMAKIIPSNSRIFLRFTRESNFGQVRLMAFDGLLLTSAWCYNPDILEYLATVITSDTSLTIQRHVAANVTLSLALLFVMEQLTLSEKSPVLLEDDGDKQIYPPDEDKRHSVENMLHAIRHDDAIITQLSMIFKQFLTPALTSPNTDHQIRWCILKLADLLCEGNPETTPAQIIGSSIPVFEYSNPPLSSTRVKSMQLLKAQSSGMSTSDLTVCRNIVKKLRTNKFCQVFLRPVDPLLDYAPDYHDIVKNPMDIGTISSQLEMGLYIDRFSFESDFRLMISNAQLYNPDDSVIFHQALFVSTFFDMEWDRIQRTLDARRSRNITFVDHKINLPAKRKARDEVQAALEDSSPPKKLKVDQEGSSSYSAVTFEPNQPIPTEEATPASLIIARLDPTQNMTWVEKRGLQNILSNIQLDEKSSIFREAVDPARLGIPDYYEKIPKTKARDLRMIRGNLDNNRYRSVEAFEGDMALMFENALKYNGKGSYVGKLTVALRTRFKSEMTRWKASIS